MFLERYCGIGLGPESDGKLLGIIRGGKKVRFVDIRGRNYGLSASISGIVFNLIHSYLYFATFRSAKVCILNKVSRYGCEKECGYINFFLM